ncbi:DNA polymerase III subunit delta' [Liberiplasma polymorphum]|uniref:DNA polymerase III subunit delta' n=1 Tax=Liberiplasma polymorphum TaxID=3374570 RepID=UPI00377183A0
MNYDTLRSSQKEAIKILENSYKNNRLSHAYIFEGEAGTKKFDTALFFASLLLCQSETNKPCGSCHNCRRINHLTHPNIYTIKPSKRQIVKEDIRLLQEEFNKTAIEEGSKIYIIEQADTMNAYASNALLKFLEEPHPNIYAILLTSDAKQLLTTIRSRSQLIHFNNLPSKAIYTALIEDGYEEQLARLASAKTSTITEAQAFLSMPNLFELLDLVYVMYEHLANGKSLVIAFQEEAQSLLRSTEDYIALIDLMIYYQKDIIYGKMNHYKKMIFKDQHAIIESIIPFKSKAMLLEELELMLVLKNKLTQYINERLAFDNLMLALERRIEREE